VSLNNTPISQLQRDSLGRELTRQQGALTTHTDYDPQGRLLQQQAFNKETKHRPIQREYGYDPAGNIRWINDGGDKTVYVYDALNRLKHAANADAEFFVFDPAGNLLHMGGESTLAPGKVKGNRLIVQGDKKFEYDARGNLTQENSGKEGKLQKQFIYNLNNQCKVTHATR
ncbi:MAG: RHS repeat protein, partial [Gammaproteobacteria bacterium]|nr:RHS repeat protein [Gammaproteobacteria bacterium]